MQIILFDIDGTLINTGGAGQQAMRHVARQSAGRSPDDVGLQFAGRTDRAIISDHFRTYGMPDNAENFARFRTTFLGRLREQLPLADGAILPGIESTLDHLGGQPHIRLGLLTGNMREAARIKLDHFGLTPHFLHEGNLFGGFGDEHADRDDVARAALVEVRSRFGADVAPSQIWVIGDTPHDVKCARAIGASVLAVATGQYTLAELAATQPDVLIATMELSHPWRTEVTRRPDSLPDLDEPLPR